MMIISDEDELFFRILLQFTQNSSIQQQMFLLI